MVCKKPFVKGVQRIGCGQCIPCRINLRRLKTHRIMLESFAHPATTFATLTYDDAHLPLSRSGRPTLVRKHVQDWLKRLRKVVSVRFHYVGEYGDRTWRPHYHAILFGIDCLDPVGRIRRGTLQKRCNCPHCQLVRKTWGQGDTSLDSFTPESAQYVAGYVTKKLTKPDDMRNHVHRAQHKILLGDRAPEFGQPSLKPGLGANSLGHILEALCSTGGANKLSLQGDVPDSLRHGKRILPLGRYLRKKLRELYGFEETGAQPGWLEKIAEEMQLMRETFEANPKNKDKCFYQVQAEEMLQKVRNIEAKHNLFSRRSM